MLVEVLAWDLKNRLICLKFYCNFAIDETRILIQKLFIPRRIENLENQILRSDETNISLKMFLKLTNFFPFLELCGIV